MARFGDDMTVFVVRRWKTVVHIEEHNGWDSKQITGRLKALCEQHKGSGQTARQVKCCVDDTGAWGSGVIDQADGYKFVGINAAVRTGDDPDSYNVRTRLWIDSSKPRFAKNSGFS